MPTAPTGAPDAAVYKEVMFVDRDWRGMDGRWFTGGYDEIGMDVQLRRVGTEMTVVQEGIPDMIPLEGCYLGWQDSLDKMIRLVQPEINE